MSETLRILEALTRRNEELAQELIHDTGADLRRLATILSQLVPSSQPVEVFEAEQERKVLRLVRGL